MKQIVRDRLLEICPEKNLENLSREDLKNDTNVAFKIIGYEPVDLGTNVSTVADELCNGKSFDSLAEFIYEVWRIDYEHQ